MGITEKNEWVQDIVVEEFSDLTGLLGGIEGDTVVYSKNASLLFGKLVSKFRVKAKFVSGLMTIDDFSHHFVTLIEKKNSQKDAISLIMQKKIEEISGNVYKLNELVYSELLPKSEEPNQRLREEMHYCLQLGKLRNKLITIYGAPRDDEKWFSAKTVQQLADIFFWAQYRPN